MARNKNNNTSNEMLNEEEVKQVLDFAANYYRTAMNVATPDLVNNALKNITTNPLQAKEETIKQAFEDPNNNEDKLVGMMEYFEIVNMLTKRTLYYMSALPSFDMTYTCTNIEDPKEYKSEEYKKDYNKMKDFFSKFDMKQQFSYVMKQMMRQETGYYIFRNDTKEYVFQELPQQYCKITGKWDYGLLFDFNMYWFMKPGVDIDMYPNSMKKMYNNLIEEGNKLYNPANPIGKRNSVWSYWSQTDPTQGYWAFKFNIDNYTNIPYLAGTYPDAVLRPLIRQLQTNQYILAAQKVMVGLIPLLKDAKSGQVKDQFAISPKQMGTYLGLLKQGLSDVLKVGGVPFSDVKVLDFPVSDSSMYNVYNTNSAATSGVTSRVIYSSDKMTAAEMEASKEVDEMIVTYVYPMFEKFLKYQVNKLTKKYKFDFKLEGSKYSTNRKERFENWKSMASVGIVLPQKLAAAIGMLPFELESQMQEASNSDFVKNLITLQNLNTSGFNTQSAGRNKLEATEESDSSERRIDNE